MKTIDLLQYYICTGKDKDNKDILIRVTEDTSFNPSINVDKYSPKYKCNKVQPEYAASKTYKYDVDIDLEDQPLQDWFVEHEDDSNVSTSVIRIWAEDGTDTARPAKKADFLWNGNPLDGDANGPIKTTGELTMVSDGWAVGTFDTKTNTFTAG